MKNDLSLRRLGALPFSANGQNHEFLAGQIHRIITQDDFPRQEIAVMRLLTIGFSNKETANKLGLSIKTVECYRARIYKRLGIRDGVTLVHCAIRLGIIPCPLHGTPDKGNGNHQ